MLVFANRGCTQSGCGQVGVASPACLGEERAHGPDEGGSGGGVNPPTQGEEEPSHPAATQVVPQPARWTKAAQTRKGA